MIQTFQRCFVASLHRSGNLTIQRVNGLTVRGLLAGTVLCWPVWAGGQPSPPVVNSVQSASGQFVVTGPAQFSPLVHPPGVGLNTNLVRLEPALLSVSAERIKDSLRRKLGIKPNAPWQGKIFLDSASGAIARRRRHDCLPAVPQRLELSGAVAGRPVADPFPARDDRRAVAGISQSQRHGARTAEIPAWLTDGLSQQLAVAGSPEIVLSAPGRLVNGLPQNRMVTTQRGLDPLADARRVLRDHAALTFDQLSWPTDAQLTGGDGGVYRASAQLFVSELLRLKNGPAHLRAMLAALPRCYNWQTAFQSAFQRRFSPAARRGKMVGAAGREFRRARSRSAVDARRQPRKAG